MLLPWLPGAEGNVLFMRLLLDQQWWSVIHWWCLILGRCSGVKAVWRDLHDGLVFMLGSGCLADIPGNVSLGWSRGCDGNHLRTVPAHSPFCPAALLSQPKDSPSKHHLESSQRRGKSPFRRDSTLAKECNPFFFFNKVSNPTHLLGTQCQKHVHFLTFNYDLSLKPQCTLSLTWCWLWHS